MIKERRPRQAATCRNKFLAAFAKTKKTEVAASLAQQNSEDTPDAGFDNEEAGQQSATLGQASNKLPIFNTPGFRPTRVPRSRVACFEFGGI